MIEYNEAVNTETLCRYLERGPLSHSTLAQMHIDGYKHGYATVRFDEEGHVRNVTPANNYGLQE